VLICVTAVDRGMPPLWIPRKWCAFGHPRAASGKLDVKACEKVAKTAGW